MPNIALKFWPREACLLSGVGKKTSSGIVIDNCSAGAAVYGPYITLDPGDYVASVYFDHQKMLTGSATMDVFAGGTRAIKSALFDLGKVSASGNKIELEFSIDQKKSRLEIRLFCANQVTATITGVELTSYDEIVDDAGSRLSQGIATSGLISRLDRLELLTRGGSATYVGNNRILAKIVVGSNVFAFLMPADDVLIVPAAVVSGVYESGVTQYFADNINPSDNCLDIGANYGYYTCLMARLAPQGKTIGIEPNGPLFDLTRDNIHINSLQMIADAVHGAVSDQSGKLTLYRRPTRTGNTSIAVVSEALVEKLGEPAPEAFEVDSMSIDDLQRSLGGKIDMIKIDVEGAEPLAFRGMTQTLAANPNLKIVMEWSRGQIRGAGFDVSEFVAALGALGLQAAVIGPGGLLRPIALTDLLTEKYYSGVLLQANR
jgi:FkbM family methyltransferase